MLNKPGKAVQYFIIPGSVLEFEAERFGKDLQHPTMPGIHPKALAGFAEAWQNFDEVVK